MRTQNLSQKIAFAAYTTPAAARASSSYGNDDTAVIDGSLYDRLLAAVMVGTLAGAGTINGRWQHCSGSVSSDSAWADVNSSASQAITPTVTSTSNDKLILSELRLDQPNSANSAAPVQRYVRFVVNTAVSTWVGGAVVIGEPKFGPATGVDSTGVVSVVVY